MTRTFRILCLGLWGLSAIACAGLQVRETHPEVADAAALLALIDSRALREPIAGQASLRMEGPRGRQSANLAFLLAPPDQVRIDATTLFGISLVTLVADAEKFSLFEHGVNRFITGLVDEGLRQALPVPLRPLELMTLMTGVPPLEDFVLDPMSFTADGTYYYLRLVSPGREMAIRVTRATGLVRDVLYAPGDVRLRFLRYRETPRGPMPEQVEVTAGGENGFAASGTLGSWNFSPEPDAEAFVLTPPPGAGIYRFDPSKSEE
jgi:hypothetical protein